MRTVAVVAGRPRQDEQLQEKPCPADDRRQGGELPPAAAAAVVEPFGDDRVGDEDDQGQGGVMRVAARHQVRQIDVGRRIGIDAGMPGHVAQAHDPVEDDRGHDENEQIELAPAHAAVNIEDKADKLHDRTCLNQGL